MHRLQHKKPEFIFMDHFEEKKDLTVGGVQKNGLLSLFFQIFCQNCQFSCVFKWFYEVYWSTESNVKDTGPVWWTFWKIQEKRWKG